MFPGDHDDLDAGVGAFLDRVGHFWSGRIFEADKASQCEVLLQIFPVVLFSKGSAGV